MKTQLTAEQLAKRAKTNKKIIKFFLLPTFLIIAILIFLPGDPDSPEEIRQQTIDSQFGGFNQHHYKLVEFVKAQMNDPSSFEHLETKYWDQDSLLVVQMDFTGKNGFNAVMRHTIIAKCTVETGRVYDIIRFD